MNGVDVLNNVINYCEVQELKLIREGRMSGNAAKVGQSEAYHDIGRMLGKMIGREVDPFSN